ncbi:hypothetical protein BDW69DRAFT_189455 [Aspergillus filifer]
MPRRLVTPIQLNDPTLPREASLCNGEWIQSQSTRSFEIEDPGTGHPFATCPANIPEDVPHYITSSQTAFLSYKDTKPTHSRPVSPPLAQPPNKILPHSSNTKQESPLLKSSPNSSTP